ncbi:hypothetical protein T492DRAFT_105984 [Pavlovales sp. CCMP2436]|nr:hypothetical protein T492DRAFT_105984 [Pavlovales sp. CCMP2436]
MQGEALAAGRAGAELGAELVLSAMNARGRSQLELALDAMVGGLPIVSARTEGVQLEIFGGLLSASCLGALLLARECHAAHEFTAVDARSTAFALLNPFKKVPTLRTADGVVIGESAAILRFVAARFGPKHLYPAGVDAGACARIDFAIDAFANEGCVRGHTAVVLSILGFAKAPDDLPAECARYELACEQWCALFLADARFVGGEVPCIADFKVAPFFFAW